MTDRRPEPCRGVGPSAGDRPPSPPGRSVTVEGLGDRGLSDAIGFVVVFGLIVTTISVVYTAGFQSLDDVRQGERINNARRAYDVFDDNMEDIILRGAPSRATELKLTDARLTGGDAVTMNVTVIRDGDPSKNLSRQVRVEPIVFEASTSGSMVYSLGATFEEQSGGVWMTNQPEMVLTADRLFIPIVTTSVGSQTAISGTTTVLVRSDLRSHATLVSNSTPSDVILNITTPRADAWRDFIEDTPGATCPAATNDATFVNCEFDAVDRVVVTYVKIDVFFRN